MFSLLTLQITKVEYEVSEMPEVFAIRTPRQNALRVGRQKLSSRQSVAATNPLQTLLLQKKLDFRSGFSQRSRLWKKTSFKNAGIVVRYLFYNWCFAPSTLVLAPKVKIVEETLASLC